MYDRYCELRDAKGYRDSDVAKKTGITPSTFSDWKKGKSIPNADKQRKIAALFGVSVEYLATGNNLQYETESGTKYYLSEETARIAQEAHDNPDLRALFDAARGVRPEDMRIAIDMLKRFKETNPDG